MPVAVRMLKDRMSQGATLRACEEKEWMPALTEEAITDDYPPTINNEPQICFGSSPKSEWYLQMRVSMLGLVLRKTTISSRAGTRLGAQEPPGTHARTESNPFVSKVSPMSSSFRFRSFGASAATSLHPQLKVCPSL